jgi:hypothetical protein
MGHDKHQGLYITFNLSMDTSPQNSYFNYFTTTKIKIKHTKREGGESITKQKQQQQQQQQQIYVMALCGSGQYCKPFMHICCLFFQGRRLFYPGEGSSRFL